MRRSEQRQVHRPSLDLGTEITYQVIKAFKVFKTRIYAILEHISKETIRSLSKEIYEFIKEALYEFGGDLSDEQKGAILNLYIRFWINHECELDISDTVYYTRYQDSKFRTTDGKYPIKAPMLAGFNLSGADLFDLEINSLVFLSVILKGANFSKIKMPYSYFEDCDFSGSTMYDPKDERNMYDAHYYTNLNQCLFVRCNLRNLDMYHVGLTDAKFVSCDVRSSVFHSRDMSFVKFSICNNATKGIYPIALECARSERYVGMQNVDVPEVMNYWTAKHQAKEVIPDLLLGAIQESEKSKKVNTSTIRQRASLYK